ncbi:uncharacterized protein METZ01_LOCUS239964, partial [marine metagenome]
MACNQGAKLTQARSEGTAYEHLALGGDIAGLPAATEPY